MGSIPLEISLVSRLGQSGSLQHPIHLLQRMVPLDRMRLGGEGSCILRYGGVEDFAVIGFRSHSPPLHHICSTCMWFFQCPSHIPLFRLKFMSTSDFEAIVNEYLSHYQYSDAQDMVRTCITLTAWSCLYEYVQMSRFSSELTQAYPRTWGRPCL